MITGKQYEKAKQFVFRHGRLLDRKRFSYHFEDGSKEEVLQALIGYQNPDGGFGNGLELDIMCPHSSGICTEVGLFYLLELNIVEGEVVDRVEHWALSRQREDGTLPHPTEELEKYPHGNWWKGDDSIRVFSVAGLLGKMDRGSNEFFARTSALFEKTPFPEEKDIGVYSYPLSLYLRYGRGAERFAHCLSKVNRRFPEMLKEFEWHCPLFFNGFGWGSDDIESATWESEARKAVKTLGEDGGVVVPQYARLPWWRPVWTLNMLVVMKERSLLDLQG